MTAPYNINLLVLLAAADDEWSNLAEINVRLFDLITTMSECCRDVVWMGLVNAVLEM